jgi:predicted metal-dependent hydrolase
MGGHRKTARVRRARLQADRPPRYPDRMASTGDPQHVTIDADGAVLPLRLRRHPRARRISLRADARAGAIFLVLPPRASLAAALGFARSQAGWIAKRLSALPPPLPFAPGATLEILGERVAIRHDPAMRGAARRDGPTLVVGGHPDFVARRVRDHLRAEARRALGERALPMARSVERTIASLRVADTRSRWGSCARGGRLSFSWRLVLAPPEILDYVVAHEVAHLVHHDHGPGFWRLVDRLTPHRTHAQGWLRRHGGGLLRAGPA